VLPAASGGLPHDRLLSLARERPRHRHLVCAGLEGRGLRFGAVEADQCFDMSIVIESRCVCPSSSRLLRKAETIPSSQHADDCQEDVVSSGNETGFFSSLLGSPLRSLNPTNSTHGPPPQRQCGTIRM
jgi:hypothetical protein